MSPSPSPIDADAPSSGGPIRARKEPELTLELLERLPAALALRLCSKLAAGEPGFAAQGWIRHGCLAHKEEAGAFGDGRAERSWEKHPCVPLELARAGAWPELLECLGAMRATREAAVARVERQGPRREASEAFFPFESLVDSWRSEERGATLMSEREFLSRLVALSASGPAEWVDRVVPAALAACGWDQPKRGRLIGAEAIAELAFHGQAKGIELLAGLEWDKRSRWGGVGDMDFLSQARLSRDAVKRSDSGGPGGLIGALSLSDAKSLVGAEKRGGVLVAALAGFDPKAATAALLAARPDWGKKLESCEERWAAQAPDEGLAIAAIDLAAERDEAARQRRAEGSKKGKEPERASVPAMIVMAMIDRVAAGDGERASWLLAECAKRGLCESADPCEPLLGGPASLASVAISLGRLDMARGWIESRPSPLGKNWAWLIPVAIEPDGSALDAGSTALTPCLIEARFEESSGGQRSVSHHAAGVWEKSKDEEGGHPAQEKLGALSAALLASDLGLARAMLAKTPKPKAALRSALDGARPRPQMLARMERALLGLESASGAEPVAAEKKKGFSL